MPGSTTDSIKEQLLATNSQFRELAREHQKHEQRLSELAALPYPSAEEQFEESLLKKKKLYIKDQMEAIIQQYKRSQACH